MSAPADPSARPAAQTVMSLQAPGIVLGVGLGGFVDGILLHQLLQWHHMLTSTDTDNLGIRYYPADSVHGLEMNTVWDGVFHTFTWLAVLIGLGMLYFPGHPRPRPSLDLTRAVGLDSRRLGTVQSGRRSCRPPHPRYSPRALRRIPALVGRGLPRLRSHPRPRWMDSAA